MAAPPRLRTSDGKPRNTPRSLCRTLYMLRVVGRRKNAKDVAEALGWAEATLRRLENAEEETLTLEVQHVQRFADYYGIPSSVIAAVSQTVAAARDRNDTHLKVLGLMFGELAARLETEKSRADLMWRVHCGRHDINPDDLELPDWDNLLALLIMEVWGAADYVDVEKWKNKERLEARRGEPAPPSLLPP